MKLSSAQKCLRQAHLSRKDKSASKNTLIRDADTLAAPARGASQGGKRGSHSKCFCALDSPQRADSFGRSVGPKRTHSRRWPAPKVRKHKSGPLKFWADSEATCAPLWGAKQVVSGEPQNFKGKLDSYRRYQIDCVGLRTFLLALLCLRQKPCKMKGSLVHEIFSLVQVLRVSPWC